MAEHIERAMKAGAMGFAKAMKGAGQGVFEVIPANVIGELAAFGGEKAYDT